MSIDVWVFCGPYLVVSHAKPKYEIYVISVNGCVAKSCKKYHKKAENKYCSECGSKIGSYNVSKKREIDEYDDDENDEIKGLHYVFDMSGDDLIKDKDIYTPNENFKREFEVDVRYTNSFVLSFDKDVIAEELDWFNKKYGHQINEFKKTRDEVELKWGVIRYAT